MRILRALSDALFRPSTQQNWPRDGKLTQSYWCLLGFPGLRADVWKILLQVQTRPVVTISLYGQNVQQKYRNMISECSFSPLSASISVIIAK